MSWRAIPFHHRREAQARLSLRGFEGAALRHRLGSADALDLPGERSSQAGVDPASLSRVTDKTMAENEAALAAGKLDAIQVFQPYAERLIASGAGHVWNAGATRGLTAYTTLMTRRDVLTKRADELQRMTQAVHRTLQWFAKTPALEIASLLKDYFPDLATPVFAACIERYRTLGLWGPIHHPPRRL